ncbi:MAG: hypothetical protein FWC26_01820 [Fibromonadales bacterium]|nr:hypothetical protein [Fibromonadales bacterium]
MKVTEQLKAMDMHLEGTALIKFLAQRGVRIIDTKNAIMYRCKNDQITHAEAVNFCETNKIPFTIDKTSAT